MKGSTSLRRFCWQQVNFSYGRSCRPSRCLERRELAGSASSSTVPSAAFGRRELRQRRSCSRHRRVLIRHVDIESGGPGISAGDSSPIEESMRQRVVEGHIPELIHDVAELSPEQLPELPFRIGAHLSTPIFLTDRRIYGTLCCFSAAPRPELVQADLDRLRMCATLVVPKVELGQAQGIKEPSPNWKLEPLNQYESPTWHEASKRAVRP